MTVPVGRLYELVPAAQAWDFAALVDPDAPRQETLLPDLPEALDAEEAVDDDPPTLAQAEAIVRAVLELPRPDGA